MRSLFSVAAIMLMVFSYIEISSGMDPGRKKGKAEKVVGKILGGKSKKKAHMIMVEDGNHGPRLYNEATGQFVDEEPNQEDIFFQQLETSEPRLEGPMSVLPVSQGIKKAFIHNHLRFDGDPEYNKGTPERSHAFLLQIGENLRQDLRQNAPLPEITPITWIKITDDHGRERLVHRETGRFADEPLDEQHHASGFGAMEQYSYTHPHEADHQHQLHNFPPVSTPRRRGASSSGSQPYTYDPALWSQLWQQQENQFANPQHPGQGFVAGNEQHHFIPGHYGEYQQTPGLPPNTQSSGHQYYQGSHGFDGSDHQH